MDMSPQNAMKIVAEIRDVIGQHVNLIDERGFIIASTDPARVGTFHEGADVLIKNRLDILAIENDSQYQGSYKGINLPLMLNGKLSGVIGITGEYGEVLKYGQLIKKLTETMLLENYRQQQKKIDDRIKNRFLDEWILDGAPITEDLVDRGERLGINIMLEYRVMVAVIADFRRYCDTPEGQVLIDRINRSVRGVMEGIQNGVFAKTATKMICLVPGVKIKDNALKEKAESIIGAVSNDFAVDLCVGIDGKAGSVHQAYLQASQAVLSCSAGSGENIGFYDDISLEIFMGEISSELKRDFIERIFRNCDEEEIESAIMILKAYFDSNGSISQTSEKLHMHKNTLQYKLNKLSSKTGHDPRNISDCSLMYLAVQFHNSLRKDWP
jgi:carbohydrate diacid regulator